MTVVNYHSSNNMSTKQDNGHFRHFMTADRFEILQGVGTKGAATVLDAELQATGCTTHLLSEVNKVSLSPKNKTTQQYTTACRELVNRSGVRREAGSSTVTVSERSLCGHCRETECNTSYNNTNIIES